MIRSMTIASVLPLAVGAVACAAPSADAGTSEAAATVNQPDLWAGNASFTIDRTAADACGDGKTALDTAPVEYGTFARERAGVKNVCFEVFKRGTTDTGDPDFWRVLDVRARYRYEGAADWKEAPVPSDARRGENRRYVFALDRALDPFADGSNAADAKAPFRVLRSSGDAFVVETKLELEFTINGHTLSASNDDPFQVRYEATLSQPRLHERAGGHVLSADVVCGGGALKLGSGAGYLVGDVTDPAAIAALGGGLGGSHLYAPALSVTGAGAARVLSVGFGEIARTPPGELPRYTAGLYAPNLRAEAKDAGGGTIKLTLKAYDLAARRLQELSYTFSGCRPAS